jgi:hypothetical protein
MVDLSMPSPPYQSVRRRTMRGQNTTQRRHILSIHSPSTSTMTKDRCGQDLGQAVIKVALRAMDLPGKKVSEGMMNIADKVSSGSSGPVEHLQSQYTTSAERLQELESDDEVEDGGQVLAYQESGIPISLRQAFVPSPDDPMFTLLEAIEGDLDIEELPTVIPETSPLKRRAAFWANFPFSNVELVDLFASSAGTHDETEREYEIGYICNYPPFTRRKQARERGDPSEDERAEERPSKKTRIEDHGTPSSSNNTSKVHIKCSIGRRTRGARTRH